VVSRGENEITATGGSSSVLIDIESVVVSFDGIQPGRPIDYLRAQD
jgi:hypothetical protein